MGNPITKTASGLSVPNDPIIPYIEGDGTGPDIWAAAQNVFDSAVKIAYNGERSVEWKEVAAGEKSFNASGDWLPQATLDDFSKYLVGIKGPLTTPVGGGIRSLNVALRQILDLYVCLRPVRWFQGVPSPVKNPQDVDMVIFRENTEDIYAGIEFESDTEDAAKFAKLLEEAFPDRFKKVRFPSSSSFGVKPVSKEGTERIVRSAIKYAFDYERKSLTLVHKGNIMKFTEGGFRDWGYGLADSFGAELLDGGPWRVIKKGTSIEGVGTAPRDLIVNDVIADAFLQQIILRPKEYDVIATMNLNGDYISDALAAQVGGIGIAPGGNINYDTGHAIFEATHGTAPKYAGQNKVNPSSVILSGEMMFRYMGWKEVADLITKGVEGAIGAKTVTYDFERLMDNATLLSTSEFGEAIVQHMS